MATHFKPICLVLLLGAVLVPIGASSGPEPQEVQQRSSSCQGQLTDEQGEPIIGASVVVKGTTKGAITDINGNFILPAAKRGDVLVITYIGMNPMEVKWNGQTLNIKMKEDTHNLNEVVVTGYGGKQQRATLTTAISKMDDKVLDNAAFANVASALQGTVTGLSVVNNNGMPGNTASITLRGGAGISSVPAALILVDGVQNELSNVNPNDIESIEVLKDAASTAIYGARANGGVILVTTKQAKKGKGTINYHGKYGVNFKRDSYDMLNAHDYLYYNRLGFKRYANSMSGHGNPADVDSQIGYSGWGNYYTPVTDVQYYDPESEEQQRLLSEEGWQLMDDPYYYDEDGSQLIYKDYSGAMEKALFHDSTFSTDQYVNFSGGNDQGSFVASVGYYKEDGVVRYTAYKRFTGTIKGNYLIKPWLNVRASADYIWKKQPVSWTTNWYSLYYRSRSLWPTWNPWNEDGTPKAGRSNSDGNYFYWNEKLTNDNTERDVTFRGGLDIYIIPKKLTLSANASVYHTFYHSDSFNKAYQAETASTPNTTRLAMANDSQDNTTQINATLNYHDTFFGKHNVDAMVGWEYLDYNYWQFYAYTKNSPTDDIPTLNAGAEAQGVPYSYKSGNRTQSVFGRVNYDYRQKYLLSFNFRYDGISKLKDNRWGFFPGVSVGWNVMEEDFWKDSSISNVISNLKPRLSYGSNGNVAGIGDFYIYGVYGMTTNYNNETAFFDQSLVNTALKWESSHTFEAGLDIGFFKNRLGFILDYYVRNTSNLLQSVNLPSYTGFASIQTNLGKVQNRGFEMEMRANILNTHGFRWDFTANLSTVRNRIKQLPKSDKPFNQMGGIEVAAGPYDPVTGTTPTKWIGGYREGGRIGDATGYGADHIFRDWDDVRANANTRIDEVRNLYGPGLADEINPSTGKTYATSSGWKAIEPGDVCWEDIDGDGKITTLDRKVLGKYSPDVEGGWTMTFSWKGLSLYTRWNYALGHKIDNYVKRQSMGQWQGTFNNIALVKDTWSEDNPDAKYPVFTYADQLNKNNYYTRSSLFLEDADYMSLREITLSWQIPQKWVNTIGISNASLSVTGQNLFYITSYDGSSPEPIGTDYGNYPTPRTLLFGVNVTF